MFNKYLKITIMESLYAEIYERIDNARIMNGGPAVFVDEHGNHKYFKAKVLPNGELELIKEIDPNKQKKDGISAYFIECDSDEEEKEEEKEEETK